MKKKSMRLLMLSVLNMAFILPNVMEGTDAEEKAQDIKRVDEKIDQQQWEDKNRQWSEQKAKEGARMQAWQQEKDRLQSRQIEQSRVDDKIYERQRQERNRR